MYISSKSQAQGLTFLLFVGLVAPQDLPPASPGLPEGPVVAVCINGVLDGGHQLVKHLVIPEGLYLQDLA